MEFSIKTARPEKQRSACVVFGVFEAKKPQLAIDALDATAKDFITRILERGDLSGKASATLLLHDVPGMQSERVLLVGLGKEKEFRDKAYCAALRTAYKALREIGVIEASLFLTAVGVRKQDVAWRIRQAALIGHESTYTFNAFKSSPNETKCSLAHIMLAVTQRGDVSSAETALAQGIAIGQGVALARDLGNQPGNVCDPTYLAATAAELAGQHGIACQVLERSEMEALGMNALLSVAKGSHQPPKLIVLEYRGGKKNDKTIALVGKGITFDSGGISLKPGEGMDEMKFDMCGAASVLGTLKAVALMKLPINLVVIVPATENMPGGAASKPGDIVKSLSGQTIEILNTDAEGRLILCDALTYAERFEPETVIDVATLTGACVIALGHVATGLFANDDSLAHDLLEAGDDSLDRAWQMPLWDDYQDLLKSNFADMANIGGRPAGSVSAACFLARFTKKFHWAHLDIAGTAWKSGADKGATGRPVALLTHYLMRRAGKLN